MLELINFNNNKVTSLVTTGGKMATPKSGIATGIADLKGVGMYTASPLLKTPGYGKIGGVPLNDDEAERRIRRRENHIRSAVSPGCHTPRSIVRNPDR